MIQVDGAIAQQPTTEQLPLPQGEAMVVAPDKRWSLTLDTEERYFAYRQSSPTVAGAIRSRFNYAPLSVQFSAYPSDDWKIEAEARGGHIDLRQRSSTGAAANYSGWTDTTLNSTATYLGFTGFQPFTSLALNLPTGHSFVRGKVVSVPHDPDITQVSGFGEGLNVGPTIGVNIPVSQDMIATVSVGHTARGSFSRRGPDLGILQPGFGYAQRVSPGDVTTLTASLGYQADKWSYQGQASYSLEQATRVDGADFFRTGGRFAAAAAVGYAWTDELSSKATLSYSHTGRNQVPIDAFAGNFGLASESFNSNSDTLNFTLDSSYRLDKWTFGASSSVFYRDHNGYDTLTSQFVSAKVKWSIAGTAAYAVSDKLSVRVRAEHYWVSARSEPGSAPAIPQLDTTGWLLSLGGAVQF